MREAPAVVFLSTLLFIEMDMSGTEFAGDFWYQLFFEMWQSRI